MIDLMFLILRLVRIKENIYYQRSHSSHRILQATLNIQCLKFKRSATTKSIFRCRNRDCKARCRTNLSMDTFLSLPTAHCHAPNPELIPAIQLKNHIKARAATTDEQTSLILHKALRTYPLNAAGQLPKTDALALTIRRQRTAPTLDPDGRLPEKLRKTDRVLEQDSFQPGSIMTDFETGTIKSIKEMLPNVLHKGCLFHFAQAVWRQVQSKGLATKYKEDECFRLNVKKLIALAFVPVGDVTTACDSVTEQFDDDADDLLDYFEKTWIGERKRRGASRKNTQFAQQLWNVYDRVVAGLPRSNNSVEGWHNAFASRVSINHPNIIKLTEKIRREQSKFEIDITEIAQGYQIRTQKACYRKLDDRIERLVSTYDSSQLDQYLTNMAGNISH
ncbi:unnamed protein product [Rotaria magnacalcarata]|uniref:MULE transposase domain-containing protein n=2 Tax=Rotaria magnacalcarata TaxID=392030 RepID=A0A8S3BC03_9BILA|nr:unnamed protein product [Rotaria magnacalcarata]